jgi:hypothetical protein
MANISVSVVDANNITLVTTPTPTQVITIDRGIAGPPGPAGVPGGNTTEIQYNYSSTFAGSPNFTFDGVNRITGTNISEGIPLADGMNSGYQLGSLLVESQETAPTGCFMRPDGLAFYVIGTSTDRIQYYSLSTAWNLDTATYVSQSIATSAQNGAPQDLFFTNDGLTVFIVGSTAPASVFKYTLSTPWDISTLTYSGISTNISAYSTAPTGIYFSLLGDIFYISSNTGTPNDAIYYFYLSTPFDITTIVGNSFYSVAAQESVPTSVSFSNDGLRMWVVGSTGDDLNVYKLLVAWDVGTATFVANYAFPFVSITVPTGMYVSPNGKWAYVINDVAGAATVYGFFKNITSWNGTGNLNANGDLSVYQNFFVKGNSYLWQASLSSGTVNGVTYLNSAKQITSGTALSFNGTKFEVASATGSATPTPTEVRISTTTSAADWSTTLPWGRLGYYSADTSTFGPKLQASIDVISNAASGGAANLIFNTIDSTAGALTERLRITNVGDVGIGNNAPGARLDIGTARSAAITLSEILQTTGTGVVGDSNRLIIRCASTAGTTLFGAGIAGYLSTTASNKTDLLLYYGTDAATTEGARLDSAGNFIVSTGASIVYNPAPSSTINAATTLTNAQISPQIIVTSGTTFTLTMPLGTTLETLIGWPTTNIGFNFTVINTASGTITMAIATGVTNVGSLTIATGTSANFRLRRQIANTFIMYRIS